MPERLYSIIDVETTGGTAYSSRITEISIFLWNGEYIIDEFSSLINPQMAIPEFITQLTGIDNEMVATAPTFDEVAQRILDITEGTTFVAHNVNFDYGMISYEFKRLGYNFKRPKLCTVRLSRKFIPGHESYSLGRLCEELGIPINGRHRARGDAEATTILFAKIFQLSDGDPHQTDDKWLKSLPVQLSKEAIYRLPEIAGVYYLFDGSGTIIYIGSSQNVYKKVVSHLTSQSGKAREIKSAWTDVDFETTGSELIARLKAASEISKHQPQFNAISKRKSNWTIISRPDLFGYLNLEIVASQQGANAALSFSTKKEAETYLAKVGKKYQLCERLCGLKETPTCSAQHCMKACMQLEPAGSYNSRVEKALRERAFAHESFVILDQGSVPGEQSFVMIEQQEYIGYGMVTQEDEAISSLSDFRNYLCSDQSSLEKMAIIRTFLTSNKPRMIVA